jgi:ASC-1-like (ASCH) protein
MEPHIIMMKIAEPWFGHVLRGDKQVEGRLMKGKFATLKVGDILCINGVVNYKVTGLRQYASFRDMIQQEGIDRVLPGVTDIEEGCSVYRQFYTAEDENQYGVVAIEVY